MKRTRTSWGCLPSPLKCPPEPILGLKPGLIADEEIQTSARRTCDRETRRIEKAKIQERQNDRIL